MKQDSASPSTAQGGNQLLNLEKQALENSKHHYQLRPDIALKVIDGKLSPTSYRLWLYLCTLFPFGDREFEMPTQAELAHRLGVDKKSILRAASELETFGLWTFGVERWKGQNLTGHKCRGRDKNVRAGTKMSEPGQKCPETDNVVHLTDKNVTLQSSETIQEADSEASQTLKTLKTDQDFLIQAQESESSHSSSSTSQPESEPEPSEPVAPTIDKAGSLSKHESVKPKQTVEDDYSAAANFLQKKEIHPTEQMDARLRGGQLPWEGDAKFEKFLVDRMGGENQADKAFRAQRMLSKARSGIQESVSAVSDAWKGYQQQWSSVVSYVPPVPVDIPPANPEVVKRIQSEIWEKLQSAAAIRNGMTPDPAMEAS